MLKTFRKYYLPGMIGLIGLVAYYITAINYSSKNEKVLEIIYSGDYYQFSFDKPLLDTIERDFEYITLDAAGNNLEIIKNTFDSSSNSGFKNYLVFDISNILYQDFIEILNQCLIHDLENCYSYKDTILVGETIMTNRWSCGTPRNLLTSYRIIPPPPKIVFEDGKFRNATKFEEFVANELFRKYILLAIPLFGMLFFYFLLPIIQTKISSK